MSDYTEGFLHAINQVQLTSLGDVKPVLKSVLEEEGFENFNDTYPFTKGWTEEQINMLKSIWKK